MANNYKETPCHIVMTSPVKSITAMFLTMTKIIYPEMLCVILTPAQIVRAQIDPTWKNRGDPRPKMEIGKKLYKTL
ncbi:hypothetical protein GF312_20655 [Candidatus Poribacteria bacterium]|nr:hypothetical protein [Candidatus Poribacteria bacterium]